MFLDRKGRVVYLDEAKAERVKAERKEKGGRWLRLSERRFGLCKL
jgi:hypothetical protein